MKKMNFGGSIYENYYSYQGNTKSIVDMINKKITWNTGRNLEGVVDSNNKYSYTYDESGRKWKSLNIFGKRTVLLGEDSSVLSK